MILLFGAPLVAAQTIAQKRADRMGVGMNLSYLDNWWLGTKEKQFADFAKPAEVAKREKMFADIAQSRFQNRPHSDRFRRVGKL